MLLLEGGQGLDHLENPWRHMETALMSVVVAPTKCRSHHRIHSALCLLLLNGGRCLPICSPLADVEIGLVEVWQGSTLVLSLEEGNQYARIPKVLSPSSLVIRYLSFHNGDNTWAPINLEGIGKGVDPLSVHKCIDVYCALGTQKRGSCIPIAHICDFTLQVLMSTIVRIAGSSSLHLATRNQMRLVVNCMHGALYD